MKRTKSPLSNSSKIASLSNNYQAISNFIHVQETTNTAGMMEYTDNQLEVLRRALFFHLDKAELTQLDAAIEIIEGIARGACDGIQSEVKRLITA